MRPITCLILGGFFTLLSGCTASPAPALFARLNTDEARTYSLFPADEAVLSDETIERALNARIAFPDEARVVIVQLGKPTHWYWSEELATLSADAVHALTDTLASSPRIGSANQLPALLTPRRPTVPHLRAAAARSQGDLMLLYRVETRSFEKQRFLAAAETKAYCHVEALLLDVRTGLIPFSTVVTETFTAKEDADDVSFAETIRKAELQAIAGALRQIGREVCEFVAKPGV